MARMMYLHFTRSQSKTLYNGRDNKDADKFKGIFNGLFSKQTRRIKHIRLHYLKWMKQKFNDITQLYRYGYINCHFKAISFSVSIEKM